MNSADVGSGDPGPCRDCGRQSPGRWPGARCRPCWEARVAARNEVFWNGPTGLYRLYEQNGLLLYTGLSTEPERRFKEHRKSTPWWQDVDQSRTTIEWMDCGGNDAIRVERQVIRAERPAANREWAAPLPPGCPALPEAHVWFDRGAQYREWRRWFAVWRDCQLQPEEVQARCAAPSGSRSLLNGAGIQ